MLHYDHEFKKYSKNIKETWCVIREVIGTKKQKDQIPEFFKENGQFINDYLEIANGFNTFFSQIGPKLASDIPASDTCFKDFLHDRNDNEFKFSKISEIDILRICDSLKPKISTGADFISTKLLKQIAPIIITPLHYLINLSLETGFVPMEFKIAKVVPVFKDGDKHDYNNYRPISLLSSFSKLMEKVVARQIIGFLNFHNLLYKHQYGFRANHNCSHPVLHFTEKIYDALNQKPSSASLAIFIDLKKAFDTVNHVILLQKMDHYGIRGISNLWFKNYLHDREQFVSINGVDSNTVKMTCGVPQGSVLGPLLFLIFINDLPNATDFLTLLFADDTTFQMSGTDLNSLFENANAELVKASSWFKANKLKLNVKKKKFMLFSDKDINLDLLGLSIRLGEKMVDQVGNNWKKINLNLLVMSLMTNYHGRVKYNTSSKHFPVPTNYAINSTKSFCHKK